MATVITKAGEALMARKAQANEQLDIDTFIFANVPGQDPAAPIDRDEGVPPVAQQVHQQQVQQYGRISDNIVVYSTVLSSTTGSFEFNWLGLYSSVNQTLVAIQHVPTVTKTVTAPGVAGNTLNRNFGIEYSGIAELTGINVDPETWQLDFTARLDGMDELTRQLAADMNGKDWFIGDGFKVVPRSTLNTFKVTAGAGYVSGLRVELAADHILTLSSYPQFVYVDAWFDGTSESIWKGHTAFTVTNTEMDDYIDVNGRNHYVFKLARITAADVVEDLRNVDGVGQKVEQVKELTDKSPSSVLFSEAVGLNTNALHVSIAKNKVSANQDRWVMLFGDSHSWGQGAADWDQFSGMTNYSSHSSYPYNNGYMHKIAEKIREKLRIEENCFTLGHPEITGTIYPNIAHRKLNTFIDMQKIKPLELLLGVATCPDVILNDISSKTNENFFSPRAKGDDYSTLEYREKLSAGVYQRRMLNLTAERVHKFHTCGKDRFIELPINSNYTPSVNFTQIKDQRGNTLAEFSNTTGAFYLVTRPDIASWPEWFAVGKKIYIHGQDHIFTIANILPNGAIGIVKDGGLNPGKSLEPYIVSNFKIFPEAYLTKILLRATTNKPSRVSYVHVRHHQNGGELFVSWTDSTANGMQLTPFLDPNVTFRNNSSPFTPKFSNGLPQVSILGPNGQIIFTSGEVTVNEYGVIINTARVTDGLDEEVIYRIDWGTKQMGDLYLWATPIDGKSIQTRGVIFDNNKVANFSMGAHTVGAWIGTQSGTGTGETRDHVEDILKYTPVQPSHVVVQIPFVNEYFKQTPIEDFKNNLMIFTEKFINHFSGSINYNAKGVDFMFFTTLRNKEIAFNNAQESANTYDMYVKAAKDFCNENGHAFVDAEKELFRLVNSGRVDYQRLYCDSNHPSDFANEVIFKTVQQDYLDFIC